MVTLGDAIFSGFPVPIEDVPHPPAYHATDVPAPPVTLKFIVPASSEQKLFRSVFAKVGAVALVSIERVISSLTVPHGELPIAFNESVTVPAEISAALGV